MTHTSTPILDRRAEAEPVPDSTSGPGVDDHYLDTVRALSAQAETLRDALLTAHQADGRQERTAALHDLHRQLRGMAGLANHALGGWADPTEPA